MIKILVIVFGLGLAGLVIYMGVREDRKKK
jgi:hypothetical protein